MSEGWRAGDLAECICDDWLGCGPHPRLGDVLRVTTIVATSFYGRPLVMLKFEGKGRYCWQAAAFRKITPELAPASGEFTAWLKQTLKTPELAL